MRPAVLPEHGPSLPELLGPRLARLPAWVPRVLALLAGAGALALLVLVLRPSGGDTSVVRLTPIPFNFVVPEDLEPAAARRGELLRFERRTDRGLFVQSFAVSAFELPEYRGDVGGLLPAFAHGELAALRARYAQFELVSEGKARINEAAGYQLVFRARLGQRRLYGRLALLPEPLAGTRRGVRLLLESTPAAGVGRPEDVGVRGLNKRPFRSFRFGTERP